MLSHVHRSLSLTEKVLSVGVCCIISDCSGYVNPVPHRSGQRGREAVLRSVREDWWQLSLRGGLQHFPLSLPFRNHFSSLVTGTWVFTVSSMSLCRNGWKIRAFFWLLHTAEIQLSCVSKPGCHSGVIWPRLCHSGLRANSIWATIRSILSKRSFVFAVVELVYLCARV